MFTNCNNGKDFINAIFQQGIRALATLYTAPELHRRAKNALDALPRFDEQADESGFICYVGIEASQWEDEPGVQYLALYLWSPEKGKGGWWRSSLSTNYMTGNDSTRTYVNRTLDMLGRIGWTGGQDWGRFMCEHLNKRIPFWVCEKESRRGQKFYSIVSLGESRRAPEAFAVPGFDPMAYLSAQTAPQAQPQPAYQPQAQPPVQPQPAYQPQAQPPVQPQPQAQPIPKDNPFA